MAAASAALGAGEIVEIEVLISSSS